MKPGIKRIFLLFLSALILNSAIVWSTFPNEDVVTLYEKAKKEYAEGKYEEAINAFRNIIERYPDNKQFIEEHLEDIRNYLAASYYYSKEYKTALEIFTTFSLNDIHISPPVDNPWYDMMGRCFEEIHMKKTLEEEFEALAPHPDEQYRLISIPGAKSPGEIRKYYLDIANDITKRNEVRDLAWYRIGESYFNEGSYNDAIATFQRMYNSYFSKDANLMIGRCYFEQGDYKATIDLFQKILPLYGHPRPLFFEFLALSYYYNNEYSNALETIKRMYQEFGSYPHLQRECHYRLADSLYHLQKYDEALVEYEKILDSYPKDEQSIRAISRIEKIKSLHSK